MPYRARPIRWELLLNPSMRGIDIRARASENLAGMILGGAQQVGAGIVRGRQEKESRRRYQQDFALRSEMQRGSLALRQAELQDQQARQLRADEEEQARATALSSLLMGTTDAVSEAGALGVEIPPDLAAQHRKTIDAVGGPQRAQAIYTKEKT